MLVDTTRCIGCRACEVACGQANGMLVPDVEKDAALEKERTTSEKQWTVVNRYKTEKGDVFVKKQCMHCWQPACTAACLTNAMFKTREGPVIWNADKCMGCRYCMISCPFDMPKFEYDSANPRIQKCQLCASRVAEGRQPACVEACPAQALTFGRRGNLLDEARHRIYTEPTKYVHEVYGEREAGGTSWLYLSAVPFDQLGFRTDVAKTAYPTFVKEFLYAVPQVDILAPLFMLGLARVAAGRQAKDAQDVDDGGEA